MTTIPASQCALHSATLAAQRGAAPSLFPPSDAWSAGVVRTCRRRAVRARGGRVAAGRSAGRRAAAAPPPAARRSAAGPSKARAEAKLQACKLKAPLSKPDLQTLSLADGIGTTQRQTKYSVLRSMRLQNHISFDAVSCHLHQRV